MQNLMIGWQPAAFTAVGLAALAMPGRVYRLSRWPGVVSRWPLTLRRQVSVVSGVAWETALLFGLYALWQLAGSLAKANVARAVARGRSLWHAERVLRLPSETAVQRVVLSHPLIVQAADFYYDILHFPVLIGCLIWLYFWRRDHYRKIRTLLVLVTGASLVIQLFLPVAPPRLIGGTGLVDTAMVYHQSVYGSLGLDAAQMSAMPSVHVAWAVIVAMAVITSLRGRWRWLAAGYPVLTTLVVIVTANHYWLDCVVAAGLVALAVAVRAAVAHGWSAAAARTAPSAGVSAAPGGRRHAPAWPESEPARSTDPAGRYHHPPR
jgi:hypothetical protein